MYIPRDLALDRVATSSETSMVIFRTKLACLQGESIRILDTIVPMYTLFLLTVDITCNHEPHLGDLLACHCHVSPAAVAVAWRPLLPPVPSVLLASLHDFYY